MLWATLIVCIAVTACIFNTLVLVIVMSPDDPDTNNE